MPCCILGTARKGWRGLCVLNSNKRQRDIVAAKEKIQRREVLIEKRASRAKVTVHAEIVTFARATSVYVTQARVELERLALRNYDAVDS